MLRCGAGRLCAVRAVRTGTTTRLRRAWCCSAAAHRGRRQVRAHYATLGWGCACCGHTVAWHQPAVDCTGSARKADQTTFRRFGASQPWTGTSLAALPAWGAHECLSVRRRTPWVQHRHHEHGSDGQPADRHLPVRLRLEPGRRRAVSAEWRRTSLHVVPAVDIGAARAAAHAAELAGEDRTQRRRPVACRTAAVARPSVGQWRCVKCTRELIM